MYRLHDGVVEATEPPKRRVSFATFLLLIFGLSWLGVVPGVLQSRLTPESPPALTALATNLRPLQILMILGPLLAALLATAANYGRPGLKALGRGLLSVRAGGLWWPAVLLVPGLVVVVAKLLAPAEADRGVGLGALAISVVPVFLTYLLVNTEEVAWRGYALPQLQSRLPPLPANLLLTSIWTVFHLPLFLYANGHPAGYGPLLFVLLVVPMGLVLGYLYNASGGSLLLVHVLHQSVNGWTEGGRIFPIFTGDRGQLWIFVAGSGLAGAAAARGLRRMSQA